MAQVDSDRLGNWQVELDDILTSSRDNGHLKLFGTMRTDDDRSRFVFDQKLLAGVGWLREYFKELCHAFHRKDAAHAARYKEEGNKLFVAQHDQQALQAYTRSMQFAPRRKPQAGHSGSDLGVAYGNRSAVLFRLHKYQECLTDIERALAAGIAEQSTPKLLVRRCLCHARLGHRDKAVAAQQAIVSLQQTCDDKTARYLEAEMVKIKAQIESVAADGSADHSGDQPGVQPLVEEPAVSYGVSSVLVQASSAVEMKMTPAQGRFLQATRDIKAGDTLIVERPFAAVLLPPHYSSHCVHCCVELPVHPVGCRECSGVLYCGEKCRAVSWASYHHVECRYTHLLHSVGIAHLSLRIVLTVGLSALQGFLAERKEGGGWGPDVVPGVTEEGRYERNYLSVYDLMAHSDNMVTDDLFQYSLTANLLLATLIHSGWFSHPQPHDPEANREAARMEDALAFLDGSLFQNGDDGGSGLRARRVFSVGGALLRHIQQLVCNAHAITALRCTQASQHHLVETQSQVRVATAIYPTASLMNHACDPTIISSFHRDVLVVRSVRDVEKGGEIFNCYGPHCQRMARQERQEVLKTQYFFDCHCPACSTDQHDSPQGVQCAQCGGIVVPDREATVCPACGAAIDMAAVLSLLASADQHFREGATYLQQGHYTQALERFRTCVEARSTVMSPNNHDLGEAHDAMAQCLASTGRYGEAADHLARSVAVTEAIFGPGSIETARELHKMAEVLIQGGRPREALKTAARALDCAGKLCGPSDPWLQELLCLNTALTNIISHGEVP